MRRKGISPLIAAVLLIAFTMAVASLFAQWAPQLVQDAQSDTSEQAQAIADNSDIALEISNVDQSAGNATLQQIAGSKHAGDVKVTWYGANGATYQTDVTTGGDWDGSRGIAQLDIDTSTSLNGENVEEIEADPSIDLQGAPTASWSQ